MSSMADVGPRRRPKGTDGIRLYAALAALVLTLIAILQYSYKLVLAPAFGYLGDEYRNPDPAQYTIAIVAVIILAYLLPRRLSQPTDFFLWISYLLIALPATVVPHFAEIASVEVAQTISLVTVSCFLIVFTVCGAFRDAALQLPRLTARTYWAAITAASALGSIYLVSHSSFAFSPVTLIEVYDIRSEYRVTIAESGALLGYVVRILGNVINPVLIAGGSLRARWIPLAIVGTMGQYLVYCVTGYKLTLLSPIVIVLLVLFGRIISRNPISLLAGSTLAVLAITANDLIRSSTDFSAIFVQRLFIGAGTLPSAYFTYLEGMPRPAWGLGPGADQFRETPYSFYIGNLFRNDPTVAANSNFISDGYANLGVPGVYIEALMLGLLLAMLGLVARHLPIGFVAGSSIVALIAMSNSNPLTSILSNGFLALAIVFALAPPDLGRETIVQRQQRSGPSNASRFGDVKDPMKPRTRASRPTRRSKLSPLVPSRMTRGRL